MPNDEGHATVTDGMHSGRCVLEDMEFVHSIRGAVSASATLLLTERSVEKESSSGLKESGSCAGIP